MILLLASAIAAGYLPGAMLFRLPILDRHRRAALDPAERAFWALVAAIAAVAAVAARKTLLYDATASADWWALAPVALVVLSLWVFPPPSEYVVGGKDPGVYMNAGVQIAQRRSLVIEDELVSSLPAETRGLFFPRHYGQPYYSNRFMGFFLINPDLGTVVDQFPHLYPVAVAVGYDMAGLTGRPAR